VIAVYVFCFVMFVICCLKTVVLCAMISAETYPRTETHGTGFDVVRLVETVGFGVWLGWLLFAG
jgi:hypothetical protein